MAQYQDPITGETLPLFVQTNERTEHFANVGAAQLFMEMHCSPWRRDGNAEHIIKTNAII